MPNITAAGTYTSRDPGFDFLSRKQTRPFQLSIDGTAPTSIQIQYIDDQGTARNLQNGNITALPWSSHFEGASGGRELQLVVTGTGDFNVTEF